MVTVALVTAGLGAFLLFGFALATLYQHASHGISDTVEGIFLGTSAVAGVVAGSWLAGRLTRGNRRRFLGSCIGGIVGLPVAVALPEAHIAVLGALLPIVAVLLPGALAAVGRQAADRIAVGAAPRPANRSG